MTAAVGDPARPLRRSSMAAASVDRQGRASRASKMWTSQGSYTQELSTTLDAEQAGVSPADALGVVQCTTRFATVMCVVIAFAKVGIYLTTGSDVVRTSALDSIGDLVANIITLYTGYRMSQPDHKKYPSGQSRFQNIGCLVFSTLMFALMFGNALGNIEDLIESKDEIGFEAITKFFGQTKFVDEFEQWGEEVEYSKGQKEFQWKDESKEISNPLKEWWSKNGDEKEQQNAKTMPKKLSMRKIAQITSEYESEVKQEEDLFFQNKLLGCCASYKCCLWLFCILYAIPKSGSSILVALATDKRNDFICTSFVIAATSTAWLYPDVIESWLGDKDKFDPLVSFLLSIFIMYTWSELIVEHMTALSQESAQPEFIEAVETEIKNLVSNTPCRLDPGDTRVYLTSHMYTLEVVLTAKSASTPVADISKTVSLVRSRAGQIAGIERCLVFSQAP
eukprot:TRINITY_DN7451_c2_g1_i1.p1 TRINITY_DN7451_c2_g1~~TRINITY_DN7451_c2_g1_i1.p1  ORF type:complete len:483 (+),score=82.01 TRINITY_DN7451_c2_g1_i1:100-1449(+)